MKNPNPMITTIVVAVVTAALAFYGGMHYQQTKASTIGQNVGFRQFNRGVGGPGGARGGMRQGAVGEITAIDAKSMTVKMPDGSSKIVFFDTSTKVAKTVDGATSDLKIGTSVAAFGTNNSDGSVTATTVQLNPNFGRQMGGTPTPSK